MVQLQILVKNLEKNNSYISIDEIRLNKNSIRRDKLSKRSALNDDEVNFKSHLICNSLLNLPEYKTANIILSYCSYNKEVDTKLIFEDALLSGKKIAYPKSDFINNKPHMTFYYIDSLDQLCDGYKGIKEPDIIHNNLDIFDGKADICIVPGVSFDKKCHRIGYGKAFYDSFLCNCPAKINIGIGYDIQILDEFAVEENDISLDMIITESSLYREGLI